MKCRCALCCVPVNLAMQTDDVQEKQLKEKFEIRKQFCYVVLILRGPARRTIRATPRDLVKLDAKL
jgi:hypothetical protein